MNVDQSALGRLIERGRNGEYVQPEDDAERKCFELISIVDHVAGHVRGSATSRKYLRSEIKSLIIAENVPVFFVTFSPVDFKHPLCIYYCGEQVDMSDHAPFLPNSSTRLKLIAENPVACARFFNFMVNSFLQHILRVRPGGGTSGLFGEVTSYYGSVE
ncbi:hypothetical protein B0H21DRAFT_671541, partial [Amylocystis lapponica]